MDYLMIWGNAYKKSEIDSIYVDAEFKYPLILRYLGFIFMAITAATLYYSYQSYPQLRVIVIISTLCCIVPCQSIVRKAYRLNLGTRQGHVELIKSANKEMIYSMRDDLVKALKGGSLPEYFNKNR
jgi:cytoplasmic iron level regulating protein YaaA (DUF328/UPF0246 family)